MEGTDVCFAPGAVAGRGAAAPAQRRPRHLRRASPGVVAAGARRRASAAPRARSSGRRPTPASTPTRCSPTGASTRTGSPSSARPAPSPRTVDSLRRMATLVCFHAHPDDESIATGGTHGQGGGRRPPGRARGRHPGRARRGGRRRPRRRRAARRSGASRRPTGRPRSSGVAAGRVPRLRRLRDDGHADQRRRGVASGRPTSRRRPSGWPPSSREEQADVLTIYDDNGGYGHPDHIQVHRVGLRAAELAGTPRVFEATMNRDHLRRVIERGTRRRRHPARGRAGRRRRSTRSACPSESSPPRSTCATFVDAKRASMVAHASQIAETSFFLLDAATRCSSGRSARVVHPPRRARGSPRRRPVRRASSSRCPSTGPTPACAAARLRRRRARSAAGASCKAIGAPAGAARHDRRAAGLARGRAAGAAARAVARLDLRRGRVARARPARAGGGAPGPARRRRRGGELRRRLVRRPRQGGVLLPRAGGGHARRVVTSTVRCSRTWPSPPPTPAPSSPRSSA